MLPPSSPSPDERAAAVRRHPDVVRRARHLHRRRILVARSTLLVAVSAAIAVPLALGRGAGGVSAGGTTSSSTASSTTSTTVPPDPVPVSASSGTLRAPGRFVSRMAGPDQQFSWRSLVVSFVAVSGYPDPQGTVAFYVSSPAGGAPRSTLVYEVDLAQLAAAGTETVALAPPVIVGPDQEVGASVDCADDHSRCAAVRVKVSGVLVQAVPTTSSTATAP